MERTISNNHLLTLFLGIAIPLTVAGCTSVPAPPETPTVASTDVALVAVPVVVPAKAVAEALVEPEPEAVPLQIAEAPPFVEEPKTVEAELEATLAPEEPNDIWARIRAGLRLPALDSPLVSRHEQWFVENAEFRDAMLERAKLYLYYIVEEVDKRGFPMEIALLPAIESAYKPYAYSRAKASGLWQFIPSTGRLYGLKTNWWYDGRRDVVASTRAALDYLEKLNRDFNGDWQLSLAAYNAGEGRVMRAVEWNRRKGLPTDFAHLRQLKAETKHYVPKLMAMVNIVSDPQRFGVTLPEIPNEPYFARVELDSQIDLGVIARLTGLEADQLHFINPGYRRWATDPNGPHHVLVPVDKKDVLVAGLSELPDEQRVQWLHHQVRRGDTLYEIARRYNLTVSAIKTANRLHSNTLRIGQSLMLPIPASVKSAASVTGSGAKPVRTAAQTNRAIMHRVRRGETLTSIARRYNVLVDQIAEWNLMQVDDILRMGSRLKIWINDGPRAFRRDPQPPIYA